MSVLGQPATDAERHYFVVERYGIADIALFAYTQSAEALGYGVGPRVQGWLERVQSEPGYVAMRPPRET